MGTRRLALTLTALILIIGSFHAMESPKQGGKKRENLASELYLHMIQLQAAPTCVHSGDKSNCFRAIVSLDEIYQSIWIDCVEYRGTEGSSVKLLYLRRLNVDMFEGEDKPGFEGVSIRILNWRSDHEFICEIGKDRYLITCNMDQEKTKVRVLKSGE